MLRLKADAVTISILQLAPVFRQKDRGPAFLKLVRLPDTPMAFREGFASERLEKINPSNLENMAQNIIETVRLDRLDQEIVSQIELRPVAGLVRVQAS